MAAWLSIVAIEANAQQEPQLPYSLTGVTTFLVLQSTLVGKSFVVVELNT